MKMKSVLFFAILLGPSFLSAHYIWVEYDEKHEARVYYGEIQDGEREKSPDKLDKIKGLRIFIGTPLAAEKLMIYAPNTWMQEFKTDKNGKVRLATPWSGQYVLEVIHTDKVTGNFEGKAYESVRHRATYTFVKK